MNKQLLLAAAIFGGMFVATGADLRTNQLMIGEEKVDSEVVDGKIVGDKWIGGDSNTLIRVHAEVTPIQEPSGAPEADSLFRTNSGPSLRLLLSTGNGATKFGSVKCLHGLMYMASDWRMPSLAQTNRVDIYSSDDKARIVVMILNNGPIYSSTNSGMTWTVFNVPGKYRFPLTVGPDGGGFIAAATIYPSPKNQAATNQPAGNWYAIGSARDGNELVIANDSLQPAPVLSIRHSNGGVVVSWRAEFTGFVLQGNNDLTTTNWITVTNPVTKIGSEDQVFISSPTGNKFYRLKSR